MNTDTKKYRWSTGGVEKKAGNSFRAALKMLHFLPIARAVKSHAFNELFHLIARDQLLPSIDVYKGMYKQQLEHDNVNFKPFRRNKYTKCLPSGLKIRDYLAVTLDRGKNSRQIRHLAGNVSRLSTQFFISATRRVLLMACLCMSVMAPLYADDYTDARRAYAAGEFEEAAQLLRPLVKAGMTDAQYMLARMYEQGDGVEKNLNEARRLFKAAAGKGHKDAQQRLAMFENADTGDESVVLEWYLPAAKEGDIDAQYNLGFMYETGWGVRIDEKAAVKWYQEAADAKHDMAQLRLGMMYYVGKGVPRDQNRGIELLRKAAENGNRVAEVLVQELFDTNLADELNAEKIISGLRRSIDDGETKALKSLNASLDAARGKKKNGRPEPTRVATETKSEPENPRNNDTPPIFSRSEDTSTNAPPPEQNANIGEAEFALGKAFEQSNASSTDNAEMVKRFLSAARQGNRDAQFNIAILYFQGRGLSRDIQEGLRWMRQAANQGHELAKDFLSLWSNDLDTTSFGSSIAVLWLKEAARNWDLDALYQLGYMFESGRGVKVDINEAQIWYRLAAEGGNMEARRRFDLLKTGGGASNANIPPVNLPQKSSTNGGTDWFVIMTTGVIVIFVVLALYVLWRRGLFSFPVAAKSTGSPFTDKAAVERALAQDDLEFLKGLWDDKSAAKPEARTRGDAKPDGDARPPRADKIELPIEQFSQSTRDATDTAMDVPKPIISEEDIKIPDLRSALGKKTRADAERIAENPPRKHDEKPPRAAPEIELLQKDEAKTKSPIAEARSKVAFDIIEPAPKGSDEKISAPQRFSADALSSSSISRDALAVGRISADRLFEEGLVLDKAGRVVAKAEEPKTERATVKQQEQEPTTLFDLNTIDIVSLRRSRESLAALAGNTPAPESKPQRDALRKPPEAVKPVATEKHAPAATLSSAAANEERSIGEVHYNIALMFANGDGVPKNDNMAAKWFRKAADEGHPPAQFALGEMYIKGVGVNQNSHQGIDWIQKAAQAGYGPAIERLRKHQAS